MAPMEKLTELLSGRPDIAGELVEQRREGAEGDGGRMMMMKSENRFRAAQSGQDAEGCTRASETDLATRCTSNEVVPLEKGNQLLLQLNEGWRLAHDGSVQWILLRRMSNSASPPNGAAAGSTSSATRCCGRLPNCVGQWTQAPSRRSGDGRRGTARTSPVRRAVTTFLPMAAE